MTTRHDWNEHDGSFHCYWCGLTLHLGPPPKGGCLSLSEKVALFADSPARWSRRAVVRLALDLVDEQRAAFQRATEEDRRMRYAVAALILSAGGEIRVPDVTRHSIGPDDEIIETVDPRTATRIYRVQRGKPPVALSEEPHA